MFPAYLPRRAALCNTCPSFSPPVLPAACLLPTGEEDKQAKEEALAMDAAAAATPPYAQATNQWLNPNNAMLLSNISILTRPMLGVKQPASVRQKASKALLTVIRYQALPSEAQA